MPRTIGTKRLLDWDRDDRASNLLNVDTTNNLAARSADLSQEVRGYWYQKSILTIESIHARSKSRHFNVKPALALLLTASLVIFMGIAPSNSQERKTARTITASGKGIVTIPTTLSQIRLAIEVAGKTPTSAQQAAAKRSTQVIEYLKTQRVDKLQTTGINLNPTYSYQNGSNPKITGYAATNSISFRVPNDRAGAILDGAVNNGATRIDGVNFVASEQAISTAQLQALKQATQDAQRQADAVLETLNLKRKEVINIQINSASTPAPIPVAQEMLRQSVAKADATTPVVGGEQQVEAAVTLDIGY
jgi:uncharacterized protein